MNSSISETTISKSSPALSTTSYQICSNCVMDTSDPGITFDDQGVCDQCQSFYKYVQPNWDTGEKGRAELAKIIAKIKEDGRNRDFDCIMGMSGGADSSYMLHLVVKEFGLRPLVFHVDAGWNSDLAVRNIQAMVDKLDLDLYTEVINWEEVKEFQIAMFKSGVCIQDVVQDHAFVATLYKFAAKHNIKYILNGGNFSTEVVNNPKAFFYYGTDMSLINDILKQHATKPLPTYPFSNILWHKVFLPYVRGIKVIKPLNYLPYIKSEAMEFLRQEYGWIPYPRKHDESRFTRFFESYWLPTRFGFDTRRVQFSSLILSGQMTREQAIKELENPPMSDEEARLSFEYIASKLDIPVEELRQYHTMPIKQISDYKNLNWLFDLGAKAMRLLGLERSIRR